MRGRFDIEDEQREGRDEEDQSKPIDGQNTHPINGKRQADHANEACRPTAGVCDLDQDGLHADREQQECDIRVGQHEEELFKQTDIERLYGCVFCM